jgi:signal transduction histidine kinase
VVVDGDPGLSEGDRDRLDQVISNLLDNAIRFVPPSAQTDSQAAPSWFASRWEGSGGYWRRYCSAVVPSRRGKSEQL